MLKGKLLLISSILINLILLFLIDLFTLKRAVISGNGNPAIIFIIPFIPSVFFLTYLINKELLKMRAKLLKLSISLLLVILGSLWIWYKFERLYELVFTSFPADYAYLRIHGLNIMTNTIYFNFGSLIAFISLSVLLTTLFTSRK